MRYPNFRVRPAVLTKMIAERPALSVGFIAAYWHFQLLSTPNPDTIHDARRATGLSHCMSIVWGVRLQTTLDDKLP